jgi:hypothetical protein
MDMFEKTTVIGEGTYGKVFKAQLQPQFVKDGKQFRALKKLKLDNEQLTGQQNGFPITSVREI